MAQSSEGFQSNDPLHTAILTAFNVIGVPSSEAKPLVPNAVNTFKTLAAKFYLGSPEARKAIRAILLAHIKPLEHEDEVDDIIQEIFLSAFEKLASIEPPTDVKKWIINLSKRAIVRRARRKTRNKNQKDRVYPILREQLKIKADSALPSSEQQIPDIESTRRINSFLADLGNLPHTSGTETEESQDVLSPEQAKLLFDKLPKEPEKRRKAIVDLVSDVSKEGVAHLKSPESSPKTEEISALIKALIAVLPKDYADRLQILEDAARVSRNEVVVNLLSALDAYLATNEPRENSSIKDPIERRKDLVRQKRELVDEISDVFKRLNLTPCCPSGRPGSLKVVDSEPNTRGHFRLIPRGTGQPEVSRAKLRDLLPFFRFEGVDVHFDFPNKPAPTSSSSKGSEWSR